MDTNHLTEHQKDQLLDFFGHYLSMVLRHRLMAELPRAYNAWAGAEVVRVETVAGEVIAPDLTGCERLRGQEECHAP